jgi:hypothetical protein
VNIENLKYIPKRQKEAVLVDIGYKRVTKSSEHLETLTNLMSEGSKILGLKTNKKAGSNGA